MSNYIRATEEDFGEDTEVIRTKIEPSIEPLIELLPESDKFSGEVGIRLRYKDGTGQGIFKSYIEHSPEVMLSALSEWIKEREEWITKGEIK